MTKLVLVLVLTVAGLLSACVVVPYDEGRGAYRTQRYERDRDRDGVPDRLDWDRDGDGIPNRVDRRPDYPRR